MDAPTPELGSENESIALLVHEMRGPLTVIVGYLDLLERPLDEEERSAVAGAIRRAAMRLERMLDDIAEGRGPACPARLDLSRVDLRELLERVAADWTATTGRRIEISAESDPVVEIDSLRIEAVLGNLLANAGKYSPSDSPIAIRAWTQPDMAVVAVEDQGPGIPPSDRARVMCRFERLDRDAELPGTGLGLAMVRETVEAHGGCVQIGSTETGGASVQIELPLASQSGSA